MTTTLITNIGELTTNVAVDGDPCGTITDAAVLIEGSRIAWVGRRRAPGRRSRGRPEARRPAVELSRVSRSWMPAAGPSSRDSSTATRTSCSAATAPTSSRRAWSGTPYAAGGIRRTVAATRAATDDELRARLAGFVAELRAQGTTTFEIKTGYGLTVHDEARLARLAAEVTPEVTFLGAHVVPAEYADRRDDYVDLVCGEMLHACAPHSRWIDVFCERGAFDPRRERARPRGRHRARAPGRACTATSSAPATGCGSRSRWARHPSTTARISTTRMSPPSPARTRSRRCCRASSSRPGSPTPTRDGCSTRA